MAPRQKDILIAVCGLTPQIVTETLWSIYNRRPQIYISEIWILTTLPGKARCLEDLLSHKTGRFNSFCEEYRISKDRINFGPSNVIVLTGRSGEPIGDIRTGEDSHAVANQICEFIRKQTERPDVRLHCSVAGGRKTDHCALPALKACGGCTECYPLVNKDTWGMVFLAVLAEIDRLEMKRAHISKDTTALMTLISKLNRTIVSTVASERLAAPYIIRSVGGRWAKHYGIAIDKNRITYKK